jgi:hypothetical protein
VKPDDVSQEAKRYAVRYYLDHPALDSTRPDLIALFSEAIMAAKAEEREAILSLVAPYKNRGTGYDIYQAIRKRGEAD